MKFTQKGIYIGLFSILYLIVAFSSFFHACSFFGLANNSWMSIILALAFEIGQAAVLFSLLTSKKDRNRIMPWVLMTMFTLVQVIGNVFSSYKYIVTNSSGDLRFFKEPIFIWTTIPDDQATVIIVYLVGALLPIAALLLTSMITNYLTDQAEEKLLLEQEAKQQLEDKEIEKPRQEIENNGQEFDKQEDKSNNDNGKQSVETIDDQTSTESKVEENTVVDEIENKGDTMAIETDEQKLEDEKTRQSHFINLSK